MKKIFLLVFLLTIYTGCIKEYMTFYTVYLVNPTQHQITLLCYKNGMVMQGDSIRMPPLTHFLFGSGAEKGANPHPGFSSEHFGGQDDSIVVIFDDKYRISHYGNIPPDTASKFYLYSSVRNLGNISSYEFYTKERRRSKSVDNTHVYKFTEQDYLDAR
jgi:hypothetical protein